jgi:hypothetical protein
LKQIIYILPFLLLTSCGQEKSKQTIIPVSDTTAAKNNSIEYNNLIVETKKNPTDFLPKGFIVFKKIYGDLNKDGIEDCVLIIKGTDKNQVITDEYRGQLDRNRRGIIILFNKNDQYELAIKNYNCFSSENEDGGVYFAPELSVEIEKGNLYFHYGHGRYGYWKYTFRFQNSNFELIGYNEFSNGAINNHETRVNFSTKKKREIIYINDDEVVDDTWKKININRIIKLSEIKDFAELDMTDYVE